VELIDKQSHLCVSDRWLEALHILDVALLVPGLDELADFVSRLRPFGQLFLISIIFL
jgi:hypothetical protein